MCVVCVFILLLLVEETFQIDANDILARSRYERTRVSGADSWAKCSGFPCKVVTKYGINSGMTIEAKRSNRLS